MDATKLTDKQLIGVYRNCKSVYRTCDGCYLFGQKKCKTQLKEEVSRRNLAGVMDLRRNV